MKRTLLSFLVIFGSLAASGFSALPDDGTFTGKATLSFTPNFGPDTKSVVLKRTESVRAVVMPYNGDPYDRLLLVMAPQDSTLFEYFSNSTYQNSKYIAAVRFNSISAAAAIDFIFNELTSTLQGSTQSVSVSFENDNAAMTVRNDLIGGHQTLQITLKRSTK